MKKGIKIIFFSLIVLAVLYFIATQVAPKIVDKQHNQIRHKSPYIITEQAQNVYDNLDFIADMHCDALLWKRNLLKDNDFGHVDIPKLIKAKVGIQAFTIVTKSPKDQNFDKNTGDSDNITLLYAVQGRP